MTVLHEFSTDFNNFWTLEKLCFWIFQKWFFLGFTMLLITKIFSSIVITMNGFRSETSPDHQSCQSNLSNLRPSNLFRTWHARKHFANRVWNSTETEPDWIKKRKQKRKSSEGRRLTNPTPALDRGERRRSRDLISRVAGWSWTSAELIELIDRLGTRSWRDGVVPVLHCDN